MNKSYSYKKYEELLARDGCTTYKVCAETGIKENTMSNWKTRGGDLTLKNMARIANFFNVPLEYFIEP